jgi:hypothetical protein
MARETLGSEDNTQGRPGVVRVVIGVAFLLLAMGLMTDLFLGLPVSHGAKSVLPWLGGILGLGSLCLLGEGAADWIHGRDKVTDPLWRRVLHLMQLLAFCAAGSFLIWLLLKLVT